MKVTERVSNVQQERYHSKRMGLYTRAKQIALIVSDQLQIGAGMDEKTGYAAARRAAMVLTANILCIL